MLVYMTIQQISEQINIIHATEHRRPDFFEVSASLYKRGEYFTEPNHPSEIEQFQHLADIDFIKATASLRLPVFFHDGTEPLERSVPEYMPRDEEIISLFGFSGLKKEYQRLEGFEVAYVLHGESEMHTRFGNKLLEVPFFP